MSALTSTVLSSAPLSSNRLVDIDSTTFRGHFPEKPFTVRHRLHGHPLLSLPRLIQLAQSLPEKSVEYNSGNLPVNADPAKTPRNGLSAIETIRHIEECGSWMVLKFVEQDPEYRALLHECLKGAEALCPGVVRGVHRREAFIFISSPGSVTPYHVDGEHNFLLQIRGSKEVSIFDQNNRAVITEEELERYYQGKSHRNLKFNDSKQAYAQVFTLTPGVGLHFPVTAPHWVKNGNEVSISFSITFRSLESEKRSMLYFVNGRLRQLGMNPTSPGVSSWRDQVKLVGAKIAKPASKLLGLRR